MIMFVAVLVYALETNPKDVTVNNLFNGFYWGIVSRSILDISKILLSLFILHYIYVHSFEINSFYEVLVLESSHGDLSDGTKFAYLESLIREN